MALRTFVFLYDVVWVLYGTANNNKMLKSHILAVVILPDLMLFKLKTPKNIIIILMRLTSPMAKGKHLRDYGHSFRLDTIRIWYYTK